MFDEGLPITNEAFEDRLTIFEASLRALISEHTPLQFDVTTFEPYIPLPAPFANFRLTPQRKSDQDALTEMMVRFEGKTLAGNDPKVAYGLVRPPFPFPPSIARDWIHTETELAKQIFQSFAGREFRPAKGNPLAVIREIGAGENGGDGFVGQLLLKHAYWWTERLTPIKDHWEEWREKDKVFVMGVVLNAKYHGRGLGSIAAATLFKEWAIPQLGATEIRVECFVSNISSIRIWEKLGFAKGNWREGRAVVVPKEKTGGKEVVEQDLMLVWTLP